MKKFALKISIIIVSLAILFLYIEYRLINVENSYSFIKKNLEEKISEIEVLNLGSSHGLYAFDPNFYDYKGFNLANVSQTFYQDYNLLKLYLDRAPKLKVLLIPVSYFSIYEKLEVSAEYWREYFYERYYQITPEFHKDFQLKRYSLFALYGNKESLWFMINNFNTDLTANYQKTGGYFETNYNVNEFAKNITEETGKKRVRTSMEGYRLKHIYTNIHYLEEMIKACQKRNVIPILITTPVASAYSNNIDRFFWNLALNSIKKLQTKYKIPYYNYLNDSIFVKADFRDCDHLNSLGAEKFSKLVNKEILMQYIK